MSQMFVAVKYPFGLYDRDEGASAVVAYAVSTDKQALVNAIKADMEDGEYANIKVEENKKEIHISGNFEEGDEMEVYYVVSAVNSL